MSFRFGGAEGGTRGQRSHTFRGRGTERAEGAIANTNGIEFDYKIAGLRRIPNVSLDVCAFEIILFVNRVRPQSELKLKE